MSHPPYVICYPNRFTDTIDGDCKCFITRKPEGEDTSSFQNLLIIEGNNKKLKEVASPIPPN
jgi:hypothetical protein